jgi:ribonuclease VapC
VIVDSSVVIAIVRGESDAGALAQVLLAARTQRMSAVSYVEAAVVVDSKRNPILSRRFDDLLRESQVSVEPVTARQSEIARAAYRDFGKGRHKAGLNFGDCFAYALAKDLNEPLLFKGNDFRHTDVEPADTMKR